MKDFIQKRILQPIINSGDTLILLFKTFLTLRWIWFKRQEMLDQMFMLGLKNLSVVSIVGAFTGMIICLQTGLALMEFGQQDRIGQIIIVALTREMSPFMTALILAAAGGSAMAAEIGTMKVSEEIDALEVMSIDPIRYLILPRVIGFTLITPVLSTYSTILGVMGGGLVAQTQLDVDFSVYINLVLEILYSSKGYKDIWVGQFKAIIFGLTIASIACQKGLNTSGGAIGVGIATRQAVVSSFLVIIILGYFITAIFYS